MRKCHAVREDAPRLSEQYDRRKFPGAHAGNSRKVAEIIIRAERKENHQKQDQGKRAAPAGPYGPPLIAL